VRCIAIFTKRVAKAVLIGAVAPLMLKTPANSRGLPIDLFNGIRNGVLADQKLLRLQSHGQCADWWL
jgi:hypothetical protein